MANRSKRIGTDWEVKVAAYLNEIGFARVERRTLAGINDKGDIAGLLGVVIEAKAEASYFIPQWLRECDVETENAKAWLGVVWAKMRGKGQARDGFVIMRAEQFGVLLKALEKAGVTL